MNSWKGSSTRRSRQTTGNGPAIKAGPLHTYASPTGLVLKTARAIGRWYVTKETGGVGLIPAIRGAYPSFCFIPFVTRPRLVNLPPLACLLRAILLTVHGDRLPYPTGKEKACSRFHVGNRLLVRHKCRECYLRFSLKGNVVEVLAGATIGLDALLARLREYVDEVVDLSEQLIVGKDNDSAQATSEILERAALRSVA